MVQGATSFLTMIQTRFCGLSVSIRDLCTALVDYKLNVSMILSGAAVGLLVCASPPVTRRGPRPLIKGLVPSLPLPLISGSAVSSVVILSLPALTTEKE